MPQNRQAPGGEQTRRLREHHAAIESIYHWEGKIAHDKEYQLFIKSTRELFPEIKAAISKLHSYHTPEIICLPIIEGSRNYLQWVGDSVKPASPAENASEQGAVA